MPHHRVVGVIAVGPQSLVDEVTVAAPADQTGASPE